MNIQFQTLRSGDRLPLQEPPKTGLQLIIASGRSISASLRADHSLWIPLRGELQIETSEGAARLRRGQLLHWNRDEIHALTSTPGLWLCLHGNAANWKHAMSGLVPATEHRNPLMYPHLDRFGHQLCRHMIRLARLRLESSACSDEAHAALWRALSALLESQAKIDRLSARCAGHSLARRRQNLLRLIRVRNRILMNPAVRYDLGTLAASASYSQWHFIRAFKQAFDETPCDYAGRVRMDHARRLIAGTSMSITEIAETVGYDSRSAFCRSFRTAFGISPSDVRNRPVTKETVGMLDRQVVA